MAAAYSQECEDEIEALISIYGEANVERLARLEDDIRGRSESTAALPAETSCVRILVSLELPEPVRILSQPPHVVHHLPPLSLYYAPGDVYPSEGSPPAVSVEAPWLTREHSAALVHKLREIADLYTGSVCVFQWVDYLSHEAVPQLLCVRLPAAPGPAHAQGGGGGEGAGVQPYGYPPEAQRLHWDTDTTLALPLATSVASSVLPSLLQYDAEAEAAAWAGSTHTCGVCMEGKRGAACTRLWACGHIFCSECVFSHVRSAMDSSSSGGPIPCLAYPDCAHNLLQVEVKQALQGTPGDWDRYERLQLQRAIECMEDSMPCPKWGCGQPAFIEQDVEVMGLGLGGTASTPTPTSPAPTAGSSTGAATPIEFDSARLVAREVRASVIAAWSKIGRRMGRCSYCSFVFCTACKKVWHGVAPCVDLASAYRKADEEGKAALRAKYGHAVFDEIESATWVAAHTKPCTRCGMGVEKNRGCNHMTCVACGWQFCWTCGKQYSAGHYGWGQPGVCEQFDDEYFRDLGIDRDTYVRLVNQHGYR